MIPVKKYDGELITVSKFEVPDDENTSKTHYMQTKKWAR
jgi:hypothetical protein